MFNRTLGLISGLGRRWLVLLCLLCLLIVSIWHIASSPAGFSPQEAASRSTSSSLRLIFDNPVNAPHKLLTLAVKSAVPAKPMFIRLASYAVWVIFSLCFYYLARSWFGKTVGLFSTLLFVLSPFMLTPARDASSAIMLFFPVALMAGYLYLSKTEHKSAAWVMFCVIAGLAIYTPGMVWWLIGGAILCYKKLLAIWKDLPAVSSAAGPVIFLFMLIPAILAIVKDGHIGLNLAALPAHWAGPLVLLKNFGWMIMSLLIRTPYHDALFIGRLPFLNLIEVALLVFGAYAFWTAARAKAIAFGLSLLLAVVLGAITDNLQMLFLCLPALGIIMAAGLRYLYIEWRSIFPRNPIPKSLALLLMALLVGVNVAYSLTYTLAARPYNTQTKSIYVLK